MKSLRDLLWLGWGSIVAHRLRSGLTMLGIVIGIASVMLLTSLGEGTRRSILSEFTQFGTSLMKVSRGRVQTTGIPGSIGATVRKLTIEDAEAIKRVPGIEHLVPMVVGAKLVEVADDVEPAPEMSGTLASSGMPVGAHGPGVSVCVTPV